MVFDIDEGNRIIRNLLCRKTCALRISRIKVKVDGGRISASNQREQLKKLFGVVILIEPSMKLHPPPDNPP